MLLPLPLGDARLRRPASLFRYTFDHFLSGTKPSAREPIGLSIVPIEAVAPGDTQVLAAREPASVDLPVIDLDVLAGFPTVESVVATTAVRASRDLPAIRELFLSYCSGPHLNDVFRHLSGLDTLCMLGGRGRVDLEHLPARQMRRLAVNRWFTKSLATLSAMTSMEQLSLDLFKEPLDPLCAMPALKFLRVVGPARGWAKLRACELLEEAHLYEVQIANLRRWNTWQRLRVLCLGGRGIQSLAGLENCAALEQLSLVNLLMDDLAPLRSLPSLHSFTARMVPAGIDLASIAAAPALRSLQIDDCAVTDSEVLPLPSVKPLAGASGLEELTLFARVEDGDLMPLAELPRLRSLRLGPSIGGNVDALRARRPDLEIDYQPPDPEWEALKERVGAIAIQKPGKGLKQWSIFESLAPGLGLATNYDAEKKLQSELKKRDPALARRLDWDTEAGAVGIYAGAEADIRAVAEVVNQLLRQRSDI